MGKLTLTPYQTQFRSKLDTENQEVFDQVHVAAEGAATVADFISSMPPDFAKALQGEKTVASAFDKMLRSSGWGPEKYSPPAAVKGAIKAPVKASTLVK